MAFPAHIERVFDIFGVPADTKNAIYDLYVSMGPEVLEVFSDIAEGVASPAALRPEDCAGIRTRVVRSSALGADGAKYDLILAPCRAVGGVGECSAATPCAAS